MKKKVLKVTAFLLVLCLSIGILPIKSFALTNDNQVIDVTWQSPTELVAVEQQETQFILSAKTPEGRTNNFYMSFPKEGGVRFHADEEGFFKPEALETISYAAEGSAIVMKAGETTVKLFTKATPWRFEVYNAENKMVTSVSAKQITLGYDAKNELRKVKVETAIVENETLFGLGERFSGFVQNGKTVEMWNHDSLSQLAQSYGDQNVGYKNIPLLHSNYGYSVFHNNNYYGIVDVAESKKDQYSFEFYGPILDMYIFTGSTVENIASYNELTGSSIIVPKYALSYWAGQSTSIWTDGGKIKDQKQIIEVLKDNIQKYDELQTPLKVVFMESIGSSSEYSEVHSYLASQDVKFLGWMDSSYRTFDENITAKDVSEKMGLPESEIPFTTWNYARLAENWDRNGNKYLDYSDPLATEWLKKRLTPFMENGLVGMMVDYNDSVDLEAYYPAVDEDGTVMHNLSTYYYDKAAYEAFEDYYGEGNFINITRAGVAGSQAYGAAFAGDQTCTFLGLTQVVSALLSSAASGINVWGSDIGALGTANDAKKHNPELYARWLQFGTFSPLMRAHGQNGWRDPWNYDKNGQSNELFQKYYWTRENLVDMIYSATVKASKENYPMTQSMVVAFPEQTALATNNTQYMFCDSLLVCPVTEEGASSLKVSFPEGRWVDLWNGTVYEGGKSYEVSATVDTIPVFIQAGAAFPVTYGEEIDIATVNTLDKNVNAILVTPATNKEKVNKIYTDTENTYTLTSKKLTEGSFSVTADTAREQKVVVAAGCISDSVTVDGVVLTELKSKPTSAATEIGFYRDYENNATIIVTAGNWTTIEYNDSGERLTNVALGCDVTVSGVSEKETNNAKNVTDGNYETSLKIANAKKATVTIDLKETISLDKILIRWGSNYMKSYVLEGATELAENENDTKWTTIYEKEKQGGGTDVITLEKKEYRYIRISKMDSAQKLASELVEIEAYGEGTYLEQDGNPNQILLGTEKPVTKQEVSLNDLLPAIIIGVAEVLFVAGVVVFVVKSKKRKKESAIE